LEPFRYGFLRGLKIHNKRKKGVEEVIRERERERERERDRCRFNFLPNYGAYTDVRRDL
jgi:hypothetical protein